MSAIGTLVFCTRCSNILPQSMGGKKGVLVCDCCGSENKGQPSGAEEPEAFRGTATDFGGNHRYGREDDDDRDQAFRLSLSA